MKSKVRLSAYCTIITCAVIVAIVIGICSAWKEQHTSVILLGILIVLLSVSLYFFPRSIETTQSGIIIHRQFSDKALAYRDIVSFERCFPSAGGLRLCGSGGFFGYWGYFSDIVIGNYFAYYGDRNQCFLIRLKSGKQYVVSCTDPEEMMEEISKRHKQRCVDAC